MARKITTESIKAFIQGNRFNKGNMRVDNNNPKQILLYLHGNLIAVKEGEVYMISNGGWQTNTTKERLNAIPGVSIQQKKSIWYLNGKQWDGSIIEIKNDENTTK